ncbi:MAG: Ig-like domain-containing protein [Chloroflexi bacterium]|nr:Ig-like domain-containing protein [Chloroflexota bacterium]
MRTPFAFSTIAIFLVVAAVLGGCTLVEPKATPVPTPNIPRVRFLFPEKNARIAQDSEITVDILAEDETSGIARVEFLVDNIKINEGQPDGFRCPGLSRCHELDRRHAGRSHAARHRVSRGWNSQRRSDHSGGCRRTLTTRRKRL